MKVIECKYMGDGVFQASEEKVSSIGKYNEFVLILESDLIDLVDEKHRLKEKIEDLKNN